MFTFAALREPSPVLKGDGLVVRCPRQTDYHEWRHLRLKSREFLVPFEPRWTEVDISARNFAARVRRNRRDAAYGVEYAFLIFLAEGRHQVLVGGLTLSNIRRRASQNATLGYWMGVDHAGKGIMTKAVALILPFVFDTLALHRVEAACLPDNQASKRVLQNNGFREIGLAENYLQINGRWRDHILFGLTREHYDAFHD
jgi:[ribosomal protein S5]-alanine N-acetyltransferase